LNRPRPSKAAQGPQSAGPCPGALGRGTGCSLPEAGKTAPSTGPNCRPGDFAAITPPKNFLPGPARAPVPNPARFGLPSPMGFAARRFFAGQVFLRPTEANARSKIPRRFCRRRRAPPRNQPIFRAGRERPSGQGPMFKRPTPPRQRNGPRRGMPPWGNAQTTQLAPVSRRWGGIRPGKTARGGYGPGRGPGTTPHQNTRIRNKGNGAGVSRVPIGPAP